MHPLVFVDVPAGSYDDVQGALLRHRDWGHDGSGRHVVMPFDEGAIEAFVDRARTTGRTPWVEVGDISQLTTAARWGANLWLRGLEAGERSGDVGAVVLIRAAHRSGRPWVVQGLGHRGMAAARALGAAGIVLSVHVWRTPEVDLPPAFKDALGRRGSRDTTRVDGTRTLGPHPCDVCIDDIPAFESLQAAVAHWLEAVRSHPVRPELLEADPLGTGRPIVQGPMANVAESTALGAAVRRAGGFPFCALGALRPEQAQAVLDGFAGLDRWGAGIIGFDVMPHRDAHIDAVARSGSRPVIIAGGSPALARQLQEDGHEPWLHAPSPRLASMALRRGVRALVFEGREAGGHVGTLPSSTLWEAGLAAFEDHSEPGLVVLAGGIGDAASAAFAAVMASAAFEAGHRVALQIGTALFFTHEIVEAGQITRAYQQAALGADRTVLVGETVNLALRCSPNPFTESARAQELVWQREALPLAERRKRVEHFNLGRTRIAAKAIERGERGYVDVSPRKQRAGGAFTMGQGAACTSTLGSIPALFDDLTTGARALLDGTPSPLSAWGSAQPVGGTPEVRTELPKVGRASAAHEPIAVVGMGCVLPGAENVEEFWQNLMFGMDSIRAIPDSRWRADRYFDPDGRVRTRTAVRMAGVADASTFDPVAFGIPPRVAPTLDRAQKFALMAARQAVAGVRIRDRRRAAVAIGNSMGGEHSKSLALRIRYREILGSLDALGILDSLDHHELSKLSARVDGHLARSLPPVDVETMAGLLSNVVAGRVASWLDWMGGNRTVDAACAASLGAIDTAVAWLQTGRCDAVLTGGVDADLSPETFVGFDRTFALSKTGSSPFSTRADGFVMGEGCALFLLKRVSDAEHDGDTIHAVIRAVSQSSDGRSSGITAPRAEGQQLAVQRAYAQVDFGPSDVEMIEAHGTGTSLGDKTELGVLNRIFAGQAAWLGSVKSNIGHLKGGAGAAGLLKAVLAVREGSIPPTLNAAPVRPEITGTRIRLPRTPTPFSKHPHRASVSAFGFGGTNFHLLLEGSGPPRESTSQVHTTSWDAPAPVLHVFAASDTEGLVDAVQRGWTTTPEEAVQRAERVCVLGDIPKGLAAWIQSGGSGSFANRAWRGHGPFEPVVLVFPGQGSRRDGALDGLRAIPAGAELLRDLGVESLDTSSDPGAQHDLLVTVASAWAAVMAPIPIAGVIGHSVGELGALVAAGNLDAAAARTLAHARGTALRECPAGSMLAVSMERPDAERFAGELGLHLSADNSPGSVVLGGPTEAIDLAERLLSERTVRFTRLDVQRAFHTPDVQPASEALRRALEQHPLGAGKPWWPNVPGARGAEALVSGVTHTVEFRESVESAAREGHHRYVHVGPGAALVRHIERSDPEAVVIGLDPTPGDDGAGITRAAAALLALGDTHVLRSLPARWVEVAFPTEPIGDVREPRIEVDVPEVEPREPIAVEEGVFEAEGVRGIVLSSISEVTGYPLASLTGDARLDADLGVDSIRKMEVLGLIQDKSGIHIDDASLATLASLDIDGLVAWLEGHGSKAPVEPSVRPGGETEILALYWPPAEIVPTDTDRRAFLGGFEQARDGAFPPTERLESVADRALLSLRRTGATELSIDYSVSDLLLPRVGSPPPAEPLPESPVVFATGGTTGILTPCLEAIPGARGLVVGRRADQTPPEGFEYAICDVTDPEQVRRCIDACRERFGSVDIVIHAAGVTRDGFLDTRTQEDAEIVWDVKVEGARNLIEATLEDAPHWVVFSSVSAHHANPGQSLYAGANAALEAAPHPTATRSTTLVWTAWSEVGMASDPALQRLLASRGVRSLTPSEGQALFTQALGHTGTLWLAPSAPPYPRLPWPLSRPLADGFVLSLAPTDVALQDHSVAGQALVPAATWLEVFHRMSAGTALVDFEVHAPCFVREAGEVRARRVADALSIERGGVVLCSARIGSASPAEIEASQEPPRDARHWYTTGALFHGPSWQGLKAVSPLERPNVEASIRHSEGALLSDLAHQLLSIWTAENTGWLTLPVGAQAWHFVHSEPAVTLRLSARATDTGAIGELSAHDRTGTRVAFARGIRMQRANPWSRDA